jgi:hypothetical protein
MQRLYRSGVAASPACPYVAGAYAQDGVDLEYNIHQAMRDVCLWLPEAEEAISHGSSSFKVRGKMFAYFLVNQHADGRVALWITAIGMRQGAVENHAQIALQRMLKVAESTPRRVTRVRRPTLRQGSMSSKVTL